MFHFLLCTTCCYRSPFFILSLSSMAAIPSQRLRLLRFILPIVLALLITFYYWPKLTAFSATSFTTKKRPDGQRASETEINGTSDDEQATQSKHEFIQAASAWEIDGPFNDKPLRDLCMSKSWQPGLVFKCDDAFGGVGNIRNIILTCIRYAIEAGGETTASVRIPGTCTKRIQHRP